MVRLVGPLDVTYTPLQVTRRAVQPSAGQVGTRIAQAGQATNDVMQHVRAQQVENEVAEAEQLTRRQLDDLRLQMENEPVEEKGKDGQPPLSYEDRWQPRAEAIMAANSANLTAPIARQAWATNTRDILTTERQQIMQLGQRRMLDEARGSYRLAIAKDTLILQDETASTQARTEAMQRIEAMSASAAQRNLITADDAATGIVAARNVQAEFERRIGVRTLIQTNVETVWEASHHNFAVAQEMARDQFEGTIEDDVLVGLRQRQTDMQNARSENDDATIRQARVQVEHGVPVSTLPNLDTLVAAGAIPSLQAQAVNVASGGVDSATRARQSSLNLARLQNAASDPLTSGIIARTDPNVALSDEDAATLRVPPGTTLHSLLQEDDYAVFLRRQRELRGEPGVTGEANEIVDNAMHRALPLARQVAAAAGVTISASDATGGNDQTSRGLQARAAAREAANQRAGFESYMRLEIEHYIEAHHEAPNDNEITLMARRALTESVSNNRSNVHQRRFQSGTAGHTVHVPISRMTPEDRTAMGRRWARAHAKNPIDPTDQDIENMYNEELAGRLGRMPHEGGAP